MPTRVASGNGSSRGRQEGNLKNCQQQFSATFHSVVHLAKKSIKMDGWMVDEDKSEF
jgi:hypothetical protein